MKTGRMSILVIAGILFTTGLVAHTSPAVAVDAPPSEGVSLPDIKLPALKSPEEAQYLGVQSQTPFKIPQVKAEVVILEIFSMYCPYCQKEAPRVNELYQLLAHRSDLRNKIKLIGIGAGNTPYEVGMFKTKYSVAFPLVPDADFTLHRALGETRTPYFIGIKINPDGSTKVIYSKLGGIDEPANFVNFLIEQAGLKKER